MSQILNHPTYPAIDLLMNSLFPAEAWQINLVGGGTVSVAWEAKSQTRQLIVRAMPSDSTKAMTYAGEFAILQALYDKGLPVPQPIVSSTGHLGVHVDTIGFDWAITGKVEGQVAGNKGLSSKIAHQIGQLLAVLHAIPVSGYGQLTVKDTDFAGNRRSPLAGAKQHWHNYPLWGIHEHVRLETTVIATMFPGLMPDLNALEKEVRGAASQGDAVICHADLHSEHIFLKEDGLSGVIDFGDVCVLPPAWDFAIAAHYFGWRTITEMLEAYSTSQDKREQLLEQAYRLALIVGVFKLQRQFVRHASVVVRARTLQFIKHTLNRLNLRS